MFDSQYVDPPRRCERLVVEASTSICKCLGLGPCHIYPQHCALEEGTYCNCDCSSPLSCKMSTSDAGELTCDSLASCPRGVKAPICLAPGKPELSTGPISPRGLGRIFILRYIKDQIKMDLLKSLQLDMLIPKNKLASQYNLPNLSC